MDQEPSTGLPTQTTETTVGSGTPPGLPKKTNWTMMAVGLVVLVGVALGLVFSGLNIPLRPKSLWRTVW